MDRHSQTDDDLCVALVPLFSRLTRAQQEEVATMAHPVLVDRGETFVHVGQEHAPLFVVHSGQIKFSTTSADGRETTLRVLGPKEVGGETWFLTGERPTTDAIALEPSRMCVFEPAALGALIQHYPGIGLTMLRTLADRLHSTERMLAARTLADVGGRLAAYLLDCPATWQAEGHATARLPMPKKDIATLLGATPETISRRLAAFEREGLIRVRGNEIDILDPAGLDLRSRGA